MIKTPATITHANVVSRETVRIALMIVILNYFEVKSANTLNGYAPAPVAKSCE